MNVPFEERGGWVRGCLDLAAGRFPRFVFGGSVGRLLPAFHFHDETRETLEPKLRHLAENGYRTVTADEIAGFVAGGRSPGPRAVALCFDDAWASVWTVAGPLLREYGLRAIVYAIPGRMIDGPCRTPVAPPQPGESPFMTWSELGTLRAADTIDVQSHTFTHAMTFTSTALAGFVEPGYVTSPLLSRPLEAPAPIGSSAAPRDVIRTRFVDPDDLGAPLYVQRSRMSDGRRVFPSQAAHEACVRLVAAEGRTAFFARPDWRARLTAIAAARTAEARTETVEDQRQAIEAELDESRATLNARLGGAAVNHVCLPWGVSGKVTAAALARLGFATAVANRLSGMNAIRAGDDPHWLKRLPNRYIHRLPGTGRRWWFFDRRTPQPAR